MVEGLSRIFLLIVIDAQSHACIGMVHVLADVSEVLFFLSILIFVLIVIIVQASLLTVGSLRVLEDG